MRWILPKNLSSSFLLALIATFINFAEAIPISETVTVGDKEWAQVNLFLGTTWVEMNSACPSGVCGASTLNGFDMAGWTWASRSEVGDFLFKPFPFTAHSGGENFTQHRSELLSMWLAATGFELTRGSLSTPSITGRLIAVVSGFNRGLTRLPGVHSSVASYVSVGLPVNVTNFQSNKSIHGLRNPTVGGWFYRTVAIAEPPTIYLLGFTIILVTLSRSNLVGYANSGARSKLTQAFASTLRFGFKRFSSAGHAFRPTPSS